MSEYQRKKIIKLFMEKSDKKALITLYRITREPLARTLLIWRDRYSEILNKEQGNQLEMYEDIISYIFHKYNLN